MSVENRNDLKIEKLKQGMNALIKETNYLKNELSLKQKLLEDIYTAYSI